MSNYPFCFPVFYACAIKGCTTRKQLDIVQVLLTGKYADECMEGEKIQESIISGYISGRRKISVPLIYDVNACTHEELVRRFQMINLQNCDRSAEKIRDLLQVTRSIGETETQRLLEYGKSCKTPLDFLAETFLTALRCPQGDVVVLSAQEQSCLQMGHFVNSDPNEKEESAQQDETDRSGLQESKSMLFDYSYRELKLKTDTQKSAIRKRVEMYYLGTLHEAEAGHAPIIQKGEEEIEEFWQALSDATEGYYYEIEGSSLQLKNTLARLPRLNNHMGAILLVDSNPEINSADFYGLMSMILHRGEENSELIYSLRVCEHMDIRMMMHLVLIVDPQSANRKSKPTMNRRPLPTRSRFS